MNNISKIGEGGFGSVFLTLDNVTGANVAIKMISKQHIKEINREVAMMKGISHPSITTLYKTTEDEENFYLFMEFVNGGTLREMINTFGKIKEETARKYFSEIVSAVEYLHKDKGIMHRDLKLDNLLIDSNNHAYVIDFGLSTKIKKEKKKICGSPNYFAPEMIKGQKYNEAVDIWSIGVVLYSMIYGFLPFIETKKHNVYQAILYQDPTYDETASNEVIDLLQKLLCRDPITRLTFDQIKTHPWLNNPGFQYSSYVMPVSNVINNQIINQITTDPKRQESIISDLLNGNLSNDSAIYKIKLDMEYYKAEKAKTRQLWVNMNCTTDILRRQGRVFKPTVQKKGRMMTSARTCHANGSLSSRYKKVSLVTPEVRVIETF